MSRDALIVGISPYQHLGNLHLPSKDAEAIALILEEYGDFHITRLPEAKTADDSVIVGSRAVTVSALKAALVKLFKPDSRDIPDTALFYFAGHGLKDSQGVDEGFLCTSDCNPAQSFNGLSLDWLRRLLQESPIKQQIVWLDCCHSGAFLNFKQAEPDDSANARDRCFIAASRDFEVAYEEIAGNHGVLTGALLKALDPRTKGRINNLELLQVINESLKGETQQFVGSNSGTEILLTQFQQAVVAATPKTDKSCPYKGLFYFDCNDFDAANFYGREDLSSRLLTKVKDNDFVALLGASGCGKSSLARAGLIYQLQQGRRLSGSDLWRFLIFTPTDNPMQALAAAFLDDGLSTIERAAQLQKAEELLKQGAEGLKHLVFACNAPRVLLLIDQFEEAFTLCKSRSLREAFFACMLKALALCEGRLCVVITLRADFLRHASEEEYSGLAQQIEQSMLMVSPMSAAEITDCVVKPAKSLGVAVESALVDEILKDVQQAVGFLPLLQYALTELWLLRSADVLTLVDYVRIGRLAGALEKTADEIYADLAEDGKSAAKWLFLSVTQLDEGTQNIRRRALKRDLISALHSEVLIDNTLNVLTENHLLVSNVSLMGSELQTVIDISHEALISHWQRLQVWINEEREFKIWRKDLEKFRLYWHKHNKDESLLLLGPRLLEAKEKLKDYRGILNDDELAFIQKSENIYWKPSSGQYEEKLKLEIMEARIADLKDELKRQREDLLAAIKSPVTISATNYVEGSIGGGNVAGRTINEIKHD